MRIVALMVALVAIAGLPSPPSQRPTAPIEDAQAIWNLTLPEAIRIGLASKEPVRCRSIVLGALEIPLGDFVPAVLGPDGEYPAGSLGTVYDESITAGVGGPGRP